MVQNFREILAFGLASGELLAGLSDGIGFDDVGKMIKAAKLALPALKDAKLALAEYANMSDSEAMGEEEFVMQNFDIVDNDVEATIKGALRIAIEVHELAQLFIKKS